jgi:hypothetical protein
LTGIHKQAADIIAGYESSGSGGYNAMNRGQGGDSPEGASHYFGKNLTDMSIGEVMNLQSKGRLNAAGRYQFVGNTLPVAMRQAGLTESDQFSSLNQDKMFVAHLRASGPRPWTGPWGLGKYSQEELDILERASKTPASASAAPVTPQVAGTRSPARNIPSPSSQQPSFVLAPMPVGGAPSPQASTTAAVNDNVPAIDTSYSDNFLTMYSKLVYQIV